MSNKGTVLLVVFGLLCCCPSAATPSKTARHLYAAVAVTSFAELRTNGTDEYGTERDDTGGGDGYKEGDQQNGGAKDVEYRAASEGNQTLAPTKAACLPKELCSTVAGAPTNNGDSEQTTFAINGDLPGWGLDEKSKDDNGSSLGQNHLSLGISALAILLLLIAPTATTTARRNNRPCLAFRKFVLIAVLGLICCNTSPAQAGGTSSTAEAQRRLDLSANRFRRISTGATCNEGDTLCSTITDPATCDKAVAAIVSSDSDGKATAKSSSFYIIGCSVYSSMGFFNSASSSSYSCASSGDDCLCDCTTIPPTITPTRQPTFETARERVFSFQELRAAVAAAPTTGVRITIEIDGDLPAWTLGDGMDDSNSIIKLSSGKNIVIRGVGTARSVLDAQGNTANRRRYFQIESGATLEIFNLVLQKGFDNRKGADGDRWGGAVYNLGTFTASDCEFSGNTAYGGGAVYNSGTFTASDCEFSGNRALYGDGGAVYNSGTFTASDCEFSENTAAGKGGGAVYNSGTFTASDCEFSENTAGRGKGQDIYTSSGSTTILRNVIFLTAQEEGAVRVAGEAKSCSEGCGSTELFCSPKDNKGVEWGVLCSRLCSWGQFGSGTACTPCPKGKFAKEPGPTESSCELCPSGTYNNEEGQSGIAACKPCNDGKDVDGDRKWSGYGAPRCLFVCSMGEQITDLQNGECVSCAPGTYNEKIGGELAPDGCRSCDKGHYCLGGNKRVACPAGRYREAGGGESVEECQQCGPGKYGASPGLGSEVLCTPCSPGTHGNTESGATSSDNACTACMKGKFQDEAGQTECKPCDAIAGSLKDIGSLACRPCPAGSYKETDTGQCVYCEAGFFSPGGTASACEKCPLGSISQHEGGSCAVCPAGRHADSSNTECLPCSDGHECFGGETSECMLGSVSTSDGKFCERCTLGKYSNSDRTKCTKCPENTYSVGGTDKCTRCPVSEFSEKGSSECRSCEPGQDVGLIAGGGDSICEESEAYKCQLECGSCGSCLADDFDMDACQQGAATGNLTACNNIRASEIKDRSGNLVANCLECVLPCLQKCGKYQVCANSNMVCLPCNRGSVRPFGQEYCTECTGNTVSLVEGGSTCTTCSAGRYRRDKKECAECEPGFTSAAGDMSCRKCIPGTYANEQQTDCLPCAAGSYGESGGHTSSTCSGLCPPGTHSSLYASKCTPCDIGKHSPNSGAETCDACDPSHPHYLTSDKPGATECVCLPGKYNSSDGKCIPCAEGMDCSEAGGDVASLKLKLGYWRPSNYSDKVLTCPVAAACEGECVLGNEGVLCAVCSEGFYRPSTFSLCKPCSSKEAAMFSALGVVLAMVLALVIFIWINRRAPSGLLRPFINLVQTLTVMLMFDAPFPPALEEAGRVLSGLSFGVEVAWPQCAGLGSGYYALLLTTILVLAVVCLVAMAAPLWAKFHNGWTWSEMLLSHESARGFRDLFVVVLLLHPSVSGKAMEFFRCQTIGGVSYLMADYSLQCYDGTWFAFLPVVVFVLVLFSLGTPVGIVLVLRRQRATLYDESGKAKPQPLDILFAIYQPKAYYYEAVQMSFKLALWSALVFFEHGSEMQLATALVVNVLQLCIHLILLPMGGTDAALLNLMQAATLVLTAYINFGAFSLNYLKLAQRFAEYTDPTNAHKFDTQIALIGFLMQILTFGLFLSFIGVMAKKAIMKARDTSLNEILQRVRSATRSLGRSRGESAAPCDETPRLEVGDVDGGTDAEAQDFTFHAENPTRRGQGGGGGGGGAPAPPVSLEMRDLAGAKRATNESAHAKHPARQLSVDAKETFAAALPKPRTSLPEGWTTAKSPDGKTYFFNVTTGKTSWVRPQEKGGRAQDFVF